MRGSIRSGFTLVELLVVIAIIAILMALVGAAVFGVFGIGADTKARNDLSQLEVALANMQRDFNLRGAPPSLLYLSNNRNDYTDTTKPYANLRRDSFTVLSRMFPRIDWSTVDWKVPAGGVILEGDQCLVFFLGGIDGLTGFSTNPANPTDTSTATRKGPYFNFPADRLKVMPTTSTGGIERSSTAPSFIDAYNSSDKRKPYLYFSSGNRKNGYNAYGTGTADNYGSDCKAFNVSPYLKSTSPKRYFKDESFQLICAGANGEFGTGGLFNPADPDLGTLQGGRDDLTNFHGGKLEVAE